MVKDLNDPTNRDSVHAMLTPGEFVLNKEATAMYGPIIEKMNNHGLQQRQSENQMVRANMGQMVPQGYNQGGLVDFIKKEEGFRNKAYKDPVGIWTIGYGRTTNPDGSPIRAGQTTDRDAENSWIDGRVNKERAAVAEYGKKHGYDWNQSQIDALASFRYNGGHGMLEQVTGGGKRDNATIGQKILQYNKGTKGGKKIELPGLTKRRKAEASMFGNPNAAAYQPTQTAKASPQQQQPQVPRQEAPPQAPTEPDNPMKGAAQDAIRGAVGYAMQGGRGAPRGHMTSRRFEQPQYIPSNAQQRGPITSMRQPKRANMGGPIHLNDGGWWNDVLNWQGISGDGHTLGQKFGLQPGLWYDEEEQAARSEALQGRPGIRPGQSMPQVSVPAMQAPPEVMAEAENLPIPGSDEAILQGSSQAQQEQPSQEFDIPKLTQNIMAMDPDSQEAALNKLPPNIQDQVLDHEEQVWRTGNELQTAQLQAAVTSPDAPGAQMAEDRVVELQSQLGTLQAPPGSMGVNAPVHVGGAPDAPMVGVGPEGLPQASPEGVPQMGGPAVPKADDRPPELQQPADVGAVPGVTPEQQDVSLGTDHFDPRGKDQRADRPERTTPKAEVAASQSVEQVLAETQTDEPDFVPPEGQDVANIGEAAAKADPKKADGMMGKIKEFFGDLFDSKELKRMAIMAVGAMATGASPQQALAFAGKGYISRIDAKVGKYEKAAMSGDYTKESLKVYKESGDPIDLVAKAQTAAMEQTGNFEEIYTKDGRRMTVQEVKIGDNKIWVDQQGKQVDRFNSHTDPSRAPGTQEYRERVQKESKQYTDLVSSLREQHGNLGDDKYRTDINPDVAGLDAAKWAMNNDVTPDAMGSLIDNAYAQMRSEARDGKKPKKIEAYLNDQYVRSQVGDPTLFKTGDKTASAEKVNRLFSTIANKAGGIPQFRGMSQTAISSTVMQIYRPKWGALGEDERKSYNRRAGPGETGFMVYLKDQL